MKIVENAKLEGYLDSVTGNRCRRVGSRFVFESSSLNPVLFESIDHFKDAVKECDDSAVVSKIGDQILVETDDEDSISKIMDCDDPKKLKAAKLVHQCLKEQKELDDPEEVEEVYSDILTESFGMDKDDVHDIIEAYQYKDPSIKNIQDVFDEARDLIDEQESEKEKDED